MTLNRIISFLKRGRGGNQNQTPTPDIFSDPGDFFARFGTVFDVGAHHGKITSRLRHLSPDAVIHAFEPFDKSYAMLAGHFSKEEKVVLNNLAVSNFIGDASFYSNVGDETNSLLQSVPVNDSIDAGTKNVAAFNVKTTTLDAYAASKGITEIDFIKIDTQGNSYEVLEGLQELLKKKSVKWIYAEAEFIEIYRNEKRFSEIELFMRRHDYQLMKLYNMNYTQSGCLAWADALFCPKPTL
jgi:FkbM family methyltransferase